MDKFIEFIDGLRTIIKERTVNLLSVTVRYVPKDRRSFLHYAKTDDFALVLYINQGLNKQQIQNATAWTRQIVELALNCGGTRYTRMLWSE